MNEQRGVIRRWLTSVLGAAPPSAEPVVRTIAGIPVAVVNTRPDIDTEVVFATIDRALALIATHVPWRFRKLRRDIAFIESSRFACRGAFFPDDRKCLAELTFCGNGVASDAEVAATIVHEGAHARLHALGLDDSRVSRAEQERFCRRAEVEFGARVPGGEVVVARAEAIELASDDDAAPMIDPRLAAQRIAEVDRAATGG